MYNKLFTKILDSSIWLAPDPHRLVFITLLAAMDEDAHAHFACVENLAARARVSIEDTRGAVQAFEAPDPFGPDQEFDGRRIERVPGGWLLLNGAKYRGLVTRAIARDHTRERVRRYRDRKRAGNAPVTQGNAAVTPSEAAAVAIKPKVAARPGDPPEFAEIRRIFPKRAGANPWLRALKAIKARLAEGYTWQQLLEGTERYGKFIEATGKIGGEFVLQGATFFGPELHFLETWSAPAGNGHIEPAAGRAWERLLASGGAERIEGVQAALQAIGGFGSPANCV